MAKLDTLYTLLENKNYTEFMRAIDETERRRSIQTAYNEEHNIVPKTIKKDVHEIIKTYETADIREDVSMSEDASGEQIILRLEKLMKEASDNLDFEMAAVYRDEIIKLRSKKD